MRTRLVVVLLMTAILLAACEPTNKSATQKDTELSAQILSDLQKAHPVPMFRRSQIRQNLVELTVAQAETTQTTTFFFNLGVADPVNQCPSIGFPIPATMQLTNPQQVIYRANHDDPVLPQVEPTGVYTGDTTGTYVMCIDAQGNAYAVYWEGFVQAVTGPAEFSDGQVKLVGPPSFDFTAETEDAVVDPADVPTPTETDEE